ncbi:nuclear transport factor 2 family protein [Nocardioides sp.]|uniref:nuclear transport factor 2 family protein n=1 Tax=Nocardioides sp. TaxID=35761 RepID=UPI003568EBA5
MNAPETIQQLVDTEAIRRLALLYARGVDRQDAGLLRSLYTDDAVDNHGTIYQGSAAGYVDFLESTFPLITIGCHYICNHLIELLGPDSAEGEVYALGYHIIPTADGGHTESFVGVRYLDKYRREADRWRFHQRDVVFDLESSRPVAHGGGSPSEATRDDSYSALSGLVFRRSGHDENRPDH